jgi:hypothetical protein
MRGKKQEKGRKEVKEELIQHFLSAERKELSDNNSIFISMKEMSVHLVNTFIKYVQL